MKPGEFYYSSIYDASSHLCACGCGHKCYLQIKEGEWNLSNKNGQLTITPSILQRFDCKSPYVITNSKAILF